MHKIRIRFLLTAIFILSIFNTQASWAAPDRQSFAGLGVGFEVLANDGSGTGFYSQGYGGYQFDPNWGMGLHIGISKIGGVAVRALDFGGFGQYLDPDSGFFGRIYLDGVNASVDGGEKRHGVNGTQTGFALGASAGMLIPTAGSFHMVPELAYRAAFLDSTVNLIAGTFNLQWDF